MRAGLAGLVERPMEGAAEEGVAGFVTGVAKGLVGVVAAPVAGALGAVSFVLWWGRSSHLLPTVTILSLIGEPCD
jgi:hypothetical protein